MLHKSQHHPVHQIFFEVLLLCLYQFKKGLNGLNLTTKIHIFYTENKQKLNIIKANLHIGYL